MLSSELRDLIKGWPADAIARGAKIPVKVAEDFLSDKVYPNAVDMAKITAWAELHTRYGATGGVFFDKYMGVQPMPPMTVPVHLGEYGQKYEEAGVQDGTSLAVVDPEKTLVNIARDAARHNAITGVDIKISEEKVLAGKQLFRREDKAA